MEEDIDYMHINQQASEEGGYPGEQQQADPNGLYEMAVSLNSDLMEREIVGIRGNG